MSVHHAAAWYSMFVCMVFDIYIYILMLPVLAVLQYSSMWCPTYCAYWEYENYGVLKAQILRVLGV